MLLVLLGFFAGSIPFGLLIGKRYGVDIRAKGSGNIGASNVTRVLGVGAGVLVGVLDIAKGALPVWLAYRHGGVATTVGWAAILGHCFSPWLGGKGGKGVATALGAFAVAAPSLALVGIAVFLLVAGKTRITALGSLAGAIAAAIFAFATHAPPPIQLLALATAALLVYTHRGNLARLTPPS